MASAYGGSLTCPDMPDHLRPDVGEQLCFSPAAGWLALGFQSAIELGAQLRRDLVPYRAGSLTRRVHASYLMRLHRQEMREGRENVACGRNGRVTQG